MGRLHHLSQTLPVNLTNTSSCNVEFIVLNYGSKDDIDNWVKNNLQFWLKRGIVKYYKTSIPEFFVATHAKNIAHKQATGDILCNLDADNYIVEGYVEMLIDTFNRKNCVVGAPSVDMFGVPGSCGKIAVRREHFYNVNGYDEDWRIGWGWDDTNFQFRTRMHNNLEYHETEAKWCRAIEHNNNERVKNFQDKDIAKTVAMSKELIQKVAETRDYIANKNRPWGEISDLSCLNIT
jgi:predicted glycosyltransferase involved in capsule biosynthesis